MGTFESMSLKFARRRTQSFEFGVRSPTHTNRRNRLLVSGCIALLDLDLDLHVENLDFRLESRISTHFVHFLAVLRPGQAVP